LTRLGKVEWVKAHYLEMVCNAHPTCIRLAGTPVVPAPYGMVKCATAYQLLLMGFIG